MAIGRPHPTVSMRRFDRRRLRIPRPPPGDRILVWFRLPLVLPFRLSDFLPDPGDEPALLDFINHRVSPWFRDWVREAAALANFAG